MAIDVLCNSRGRLLCVPCNGGGKLPTNTGSYYACTTCGGKGYVGKCRCETCEVWARAKKDRARNDQPKLF